jgi:hypothetical protein
MTLEKVYYLQAGDCWGAGLHASHFAMP